MALYISFSRSTSRPTAVSIYINKKLELWFKPKQSMFVGFRFQFTSIRS